MSNIRNVGVILSGGRGVRAGHGLPKQYHKVCGKMIIEYVIEAFKQSAQTDVILVAAEPGYFEELKAIGCICVEGGRERNETVRNVINYVKENLSECEKILFHDSARPQITPQYIDECFELLENHDSVITTAHITDSLSHREFGPVERSEYYLIQTPEAFQFGILEKHFTKESEWTAIVQQLPSGADVYLNYNLAKNMKITYPEDFGYFQMLVEGGYLK
ncbi:MAG: 2-C-methyl-D-erythritol 4-phosphate cytidylyltransferase [Lachnospiraceae bacterium]|nr:2-C-methyl-D-erythritol 4-phosphate cytidylyltransferase [Lachnospiraceae bacterium]